VSLPALDPLRDIVRDAGGSAEEAAADGTAVLRLGLPRSTEAPE
jgi:hypothetical protein